MMFRRHFFLLLLAFAVGAGCTTPREQGFALHRQFEFDKDTFAHANETMWEYETDPTTGRTVTRRRDPTPEYHLRCFAMAKAARLFHQHARFSPEQERTDAAQYRAFVKEVVSRNPRNAESGEEPVVFPGYPHLRAFSAEHEELLKAEIGTIWESYFQRGNWRMVFPFSRRHQENTALQLRESVKARRPAVVHLVRFPRLTINHALLIYDAEETADEIRFAAYDPNLPERPAELVYDRASRTFLFPRNFYFAGGRVDVYEVYRGVCY